MSVPMFVISIVLLCAVAAVIGSLGLLLGSGAGRVPPGMAGRAQVRRVAGDRALRRKGRVLRPSLASPRPRDLGYQLGRGAGVGCWASVEDSIVVLGPPRSGKGLHLAIPAILDAPGAVVTTSTRPDNLAATITARAKLGPVAVFDPQQLAPGIKAATRWSPVRGCQVPRVAMARAKALCADSGTGVENSSFWKQQCETATRCLLHAAALGGRAAVEIYRWSISPLAAEDAVDILRSHHAAAAEWATALEAILVSDPRQRDSTWAMVANTFNALADPGVLDAVSPRAGDDFDPVGFIQQRGTLFLLGTSGGAAATANLVTAFIEDIIETARRLAAVSPGARLSSPLAVILDEAANYPLPSLPSLMSDGGGTGLTPIVVLQSLAQARSRWGQHEAAAIWDAAIVKVILGGAGNADDLRNLTSLLGVRRERRTSESWGADRRRTVSTSLHEVPILDTGQLRTLPFGSAVLLLRSAAPIMLQLQPWTRRRDAAVLATQRAEIEKSLRITSSNVA